MTQQFATAKAFADFMSKERYGLSRVRFINKMSGDLRLSRIIDDVMRYATRWTIEDGGIQREYDQAAYGLQWAVNSGRVNGVTVLAIRALNTRQICELIHELMAYHYDIGRYAEYLMRKFS